jgi:hypothetical protein
MNTTPPIVARAVTAVANATTATSPSFVVAVEGLDGALWVNENGTGWQSLGGQIIAPPAVGELSDASGNPTGQPVFIAEGTDRQLWMRSMTEGWEPLGGDLCYTAGPGVMTEGTETDVACGGLGFGLQETFSLVYTASTGLPQISINWSELGGVISAAPAVTTVINQITYFVRGTNSQIFLNIGTAGSFSATPWYCIGAPAAAALDLYTPTVETVFACQGLDHSMWEASSTGTSGAWTGAVSLGGALIGGPAIAASSAGTEFFAEGTDHAIWERTLSSGWISLGGQAIGGVGAAGMN